MSINLSKKSCSIPSETEFTYLALIQILRRNIYNIASKLTSTGNSKIMISGSFEGIGVLLFDNLIFINNSLASGIDKLPNVLFILI